MEHALPPVVVASQPMRHRPADIVKRTGLPLLLGLASWQTATAGVGWGSSSSAALDFRNNGVALPMYGLFVISLVLFFIGLRRQLKTLRIGSEEDSTADSRSGPTRRLARLVEHGLAQRRILRRGHGGWTHLPIFWGFVVLLLGSLTIMVDVYLLQPLGLVPSRGTGYRIFQLTLDLFGVLFVVGVGLALWRRARRRSEPRPGDVPAMLLLSVLLGIGLSGFLLEGLRIRLEGSREPWAFAGSAVAASLERIRLSAEGGTRVYKLLWWGHVVAAFGLIAAVPYSRLRHVVTAPWNILLSPDRASGGLTAPFHLAQLLESGSFDVKVGASSIDDFSWKERLEFSACADSGNCQDVCPAHDTGTFLSPMRLVAALREAVLGEGTDGRGREPRELLDGALCEDAIWSCTLCGACTHACPVLVDPMRTIVELRRGLVASNRLGKQRTGLLSNLSYARNPYGSNGASREALAAELGLSSLTEEPDVEMLYWVGCAATFDSRARAITQATVEILDRAGIRCGVLGPEETCCGDAARRLGEEGLFQDLALKNIETLERHGVRKVLTHCAHCFNSLSNEYPELGARFEVVHHATLIAELIETGRIELRRQIPRRATLHDSCYLGRLAGRLEPPRAVLRSIPGTELREMKRAGDRAFCCGAGGANYWYDVPRREKIGTARVREAQATGAQLLVTECPFCLKMLEDAQGTAGEAAPLEVCDIAEVVAEALPDRDVEGARA